MVEMGCLDTMESLDTMVGMEPQEDRERRVTLDHLDYEVCNLTDAESRDEYEQLTDIAASYYIRSSLEGESGQCSGGGSFQYHMTAFLLICLIM